MSDNVSTSSPAAVNSHPSVETWISYYAGKAPADESNRLERHLCGCPRCVSLVLDLDIFADPSPPKAGAAADFEKAAVWRTVKNTLEPRSVARPRRWPATVAVAA